MSNKTIVLIMVALMGLGVGVAHAAVVAYYPFDVDARDLAGIRDGSLIGSDGQVNGADILISPNALIGAGAVEFETPSGDVGPRVQLSTLHPDFRPALTLSAFTVATWINLETQAASGGVGWQKIYATWQVSNVNGELHINYGHMGDDGAPAPASINIWSGDTSGGGGGPGIPTGWIHFALVSDLNATDVYINGNFAFTGPSHDSGLYPAVDFWALSAIGRHPGSPEGFDGLIDDFVIFNEALSQGEIQDIVNNGIPTHDIVESADSTDVSEEGATSDTYDVQIFAFPAEAGGDDVTVKFDYDTDQISVSPTELTFSEPGTQTVTVTAVDDAVEESTPHSVSIMHMVGVQDPNNPDPNGFTPIPVNLADVMVDITDNDAPGVSIIESDNSTDVLEEGPTTDTYEVVLTKAPTANVDIAITPDGNTEVTDPVSGMLTFGTGDWNTPQTVTVAAVDDNISEGPHTSTISHAATSGDGTYNGIGVADVVASVTDNEPFCGTGPGGTQPTNPGDIAGPEGLVPDCLVDLFDIAVIFTNWLANEHPCYPGSCSLP